MNSCQTCGSIFPDSWPQPVACNHSRPGKDYRHRKQSSNPVTITERNPWQAIHQHLADAIGKPWSPTTEQQWYKQTWLPTVPSYGCKCTEHWATLTKAHPIDWTTAESAFESLWWLHNEVSRLHAGKPTITLEQCRAIWTGPKVAFISTAYQQHGGTETFHRTLLPALRNHRNIIGFAATSSHAGDGSLLKVPYSTGTEAAKQLAAKADVVVTWGIDSLASLLPAKRPKVISVHHADWSSDWSNGLQLKQLDYIDEVVCVNLDAAEQLRKLTHKPIHYIPNAIDPSRINPTANASAVRESIPPGTKIALFGHRFSEEKQPEKAVQVAKLLQPGWMMIMAGDGPLRARTESLAEGMTNIRFVGRLDTLADWLAVSDCFVSMSTFEGFGLSMAEALAAGIPLVASPVGIAPEFATALVPASAEPAEWAAAIAAAAGSKCDGSRVLEAFGIAAHVARWAAIL